jgi:hypothetical protein
MKAGVSLPTFFTELLLVFVFSCLLGAAAGAVS